MLWGILNSVISACYIWRKVSGNCFVLLEPCKKKVKEKKNFETRSRGSLDHLAVRFPAICTQSPSPPPGAHAWLSEVFSQALISVKNSVCHGDKKRLWHQPSPSVIRLPHRKQQWWLSVRATDLCGLLVRERLLLLVAQCVYLIISLKAFCLLFLHEASLDWTATLLLFVLVPYSILSFSCPSIRPPIWLGWGETGRVERCGARDGATAGAQSDKERQITPLTRTIHHRFISHPSLPPHLHLKYSAPGWQLQEEKKRNPPKNLNFYSPHCSHSVVTHAATAISALFY